MGTSTAYGAPSEPQWSNLKRAVTIAAKQGGLSKGQARALLRQFVAVNGGAGGGGRVGGTAAAAVGQRLAAFISSVATNGLSATLTAFGIVDLDGLTVAQLLLTLVELIGGSAAQIDEVDARCALDQLLEELLAQAESIDQVEAILSAVAGGEELNELIYDLLALGLCEHFARTYFEHVQRSAGDDTTEFFATVRETARELLRASVPRATAGAIDWAGNEGRTVLEQTWQDVCRIFGEA
jgi:hypothetical protein